MMNDEWIEERVEAIRLALDIRVFPTPEDLERLVEWLGDNVVLRRAEVLRAKSIRRQDGTTVVTLPEGLFGRLLDQDLIHELGHCLLTLGMGHLLRQLHPGNHQVERLAEACDLQDERRAADFVRAWFLPSRLCQQYAGDPEELAELSGVHPDEVAARLQQLGGRYWRFDYPPRWSCYWSLQVVVQGGLVPLLYVIRRGEGTQPQFNFPVRPGNVEAGAAQVTADICALTEDEFQRKYARFACAPAQIVEADLEALRRRSGAA